MGLLGWLVTVALGCLVIGQVLSLIADGIRGRKRSSFAALGIGLFAGAVVAVPSVALLGLRVDKAPGADLLRPLHPWFEVALGYSFALGLALAGRFVGGRPTHRENED